LITIDGVCRKHYNLAIFKNWGEIMSDNDELLTLEEVARRLQVHSETVRRYIKQKKLTAIRLSNTNLRIRESELERFLKARETNGGAEKQ
jgi:excisionase family DNA binding protein